MSETLNIFLNDRNVRSKGVRPMIIEKEDIDFQLVSLGRIEVDCPTGN